MQVSAHAPVRNTLARAAMSAPLLDRNQEYALARRWLDERDEPALHELIRSHMRLVLAVARRFRNYGLPMVDLVQEGHVGLLEASMRFEPERDVRFSTYATWWIRAAIQDFVLRNWSIVRGGTSSGQKSLFFNLRRVRAQIERAGGTALPSGQVHQSVAVALGVAVEDVARMDARLGSSDISLNAPLFSDDSGGAERMEQLVATDPLPDEQVADEIDAERRRRWLRAALKELSDRERRIIAARRLSDDGATLEVLGERFGISKERVRQIENRALEKLRASLLGGRAAPQGAFM